MTRRQTSDIFFKLAQTSVLLAILISVLAVILEAFNMVVPNDDFLSYIWVFFGLGAAALTFVGFISSVWEN